MSLFARAAAASLLCATTAQAQTYNRPESVEYHPRLDRHLISNVNGGNILARDAQGTLTLFTDAPTAPYGIELLGGILYVLDSGRLKGYDIDTAAPMVDFPIPGASFLNGITSNGVDTLWVSDYSAKIIHRINVSNPGVPVMAGSTATTPIPNGLVYDAANQRLLIATWNASARIQALDTTTAGATPTDLIQTTLTSLDGIALDCRGSIHVAAWSGCGTSGSPTGCVRRFDPPFSLSSPAQVVANNLGSPADIDFAWPLGHIAVPESGAANTVSFAPTSQCSGSLFYADFER